MAGMAGRRLAVVTAAAAAVFCSSVPVSAGSAAPREPAAVAPAGGSWGNAEEVPGTAALNAGGNADVTSISCPSAGNCSAGGLYADGTNSSEAFVVSQVDGRWANAVEVPGTAALNVSGGAGLNALSCASAGNCGGGGHYWDGSRHTQAFVVSEAGGTWLNAVEVPGLATLNAGGYAQLLSVSCASAGNCSAGGYYNNGSDLQQAFVVGEGNGTWGTAAQIPGPTAGTNALIISVSCASAGNCVAGGYYTDGSSQQQPFVAGEVNGTWGTAAQIPGIASLDAGGGAYLTTLSCARDGGCSAGGFYFNSSGNHAFLADESSGAWGDAMQVPGTAALNTGENAQITSVSCASAGNCGAGGYYTDGSGHQQAFVVQETGGTWSGALEVPGTATLNTLGPAAVNSVSCPAAGDCTAGGYYRTSAGDTQAFAVSEAGGSWGDAIEVPGTAALNTGGQAAVVSVSCASAWNCGAGGSYNDNSPAAQAFVVSQTALRSSATSLNLSASTVTYGNEQVGKASVTVSSAGTPTGTVTVAADARLLCTITLVHGAGSCTLPATVLPAGAYQVIASYSGDSSTAPSVSPPQSLTVAKAMSATALNLSAATVIQGNEQAEKISASVSSAGAPTGKVAIAAGARLLCTITLVSAAGSCTLQAAQLPPGSYRVTASYSGNANIKASVSPAQALTVTARYFTIQPNYDYAGWSVHPPAGLVHSVQAQWKVPAVTCGATATKPWYLSRAAVWAGMWGPLSGLSTMDWLPQAGTVSLCKFGQPKYLAFYQLFHNGGAGPVVVDLPVQVNDTIVAVLIYAGINSKKQLLFRYRLTDLSRHDASIAGSMPPTTAGVPLADGAFQGGVIIEHQPPTQVCVITNPLTGKCEKTVTGAGLSRFASPISITEPATLINGQPLPAYSGYDTLYRWDMISAPPSHKLATTGLITSQGFSVTWQNYL
jgi:hypothetical protein